MVVSNIITTSTPSDNQAYVRPLPYLVPRSIIQKAAHFSESYWKLDNDSIVFKILDALCNDAGAGNNKKALFVSRLQASLDSTYFQDLDAFYFGVLGFPRNLDESYNFDPYNNALTVDQWIEVLLKDAKYRSRCLDLMSALDHGTSPFGFRMACKAVLGVDCDIFELWKYLDSPYFHTGGYAVGRTGSNLRTEVLVTPHRVITRQERRNLELVLNRLKPREVVITVATGLTVNIPVALGLVSADSSYFETDVQVTGASGISNAASQNYYANATSTVPSSDSTIFYLQDGVQTAARTPAFAKGQESYESYGFSAESISTVDSIEYQSTDDITTSPSTRTEEGKHLVQNAYDIRFGPWTNFDLADSPDNFPGGKYGQSPLTAPALNQDSSPYQFRYASQADYVTQQTAVIVAAGGEANATQYRVRLAYASVSATVSDPFDCLSDNVGASVLSSWFESR